MKTPLEQLADPWEVFRQRLAEIEQQAQALWLQLGLMAGEMDAARARRLMEGDKDHG